MKKLLLAGVALITLSTSAGAHKMPHNRPCDVAQDNPGDLNPGGGNAIMFGLCSGIKDLPNNKEASRSHWWNAHNCGYQAYREGKAIRANPYHNDELKEKWLDGCI